MQPELNLQPGDRLFSSPVDRLLPHPAFAKHGLVPDAARYSGLAKRGDAAFDDLIHVTPSFQVLEGYELVQLARSRNRAEVTCLRVEANEGEALLILLQKHQHTTGMKPMIRILLALELEPWFRCKARGNQSYGGQPKGSSNLTEASTIDVRKEIAAAAGVSVGNVSKAKRVVDCAAPEILQATKSGEISLHKAWQWSELTHRDQLIALRRYQSERGIMALARKLLASQCRPVTQPDAASVGYLRGFLLTLKASGLDEVQLGKVNALLLELTAMDVPPAQVSIHA